MSGPGSMNVGVDIGGTFTDLVILTPDGVLHKRKVPSTPSDYSRAIIDGIRSFCEEAELPAEAIGEVVHATTVATNAILERKGARTALITTAGFRDVLELRRIRIPMSYDLGWQKPVPLVERAWRLEIPERMDARGNPLTPLDLQALDAAIDTLIAQDIEAVAVCFLHAYRNPGHERAVGEALRTRMPKAYVSLSHEVLPEMLEFERTSTTVVNAYVAPLIARYLRTLRERLDGLGTRAPLLVMQSNGGLISASSAAGRPVTIIESGPAAGVVAAARLAQDCGYADVLTLDMGGTTTKASIIENNTILRATEYEVGSAVSVSSRLMRGNGYALRIPVIDISEVGAGGGSIAQVDPGGSLRVGPRSAGASPGPACYGNGNTQPTVTDANLVLGYLNSDSLAGGSLPIRRDLALSAIREHIARRTGLSDLDAAHGVHQIANSNMVRAIKSVSVERGRDPADFVLMVFGGAGPIHAAGVARELDTVNAAIETMRAELVAALAREGYAGPLITVSALADLRYRGQSSDITVPMRDLTLTREAIEDLETRFEAEFERTYGHLGQSRDFELVTVRLVASVSRPVVREMQWNAESTDTPTGENRAVYFGHGGVSVEVRVIRRQDLSADRIPGPIVIQEYDTSVVVPPGDSVWLDQFGNIVIGVLEDHATGKR